jgi:nitroreductase
METREAIAGRRSIRKFRNDPLSKEVLREILQAGIEAPSGKNRQPWRFVVVQGDQRQTMIEIMRAGIEKSKKEEQDTGSSEWTTSVMETAPVTVFVFNPEGIRPWLAHSIGENFSDLVNVQSVGAAIQNMLLAAHDAGIGSLWICDVFYAYEPLCDWLGEDSQLVAAVSFGYPDESPEARPRKHVDEVTRWMQVDPGR